MDLSSIGTWFTTDLVGIVVGKAIGTVIILLVAFALVKVLKRVTNKVLSKDGVPLASAKFIANCLMWFIWIAAIGLVLYAVFGVDVTGIVAALGIGGLAVSLAFQDTLANLIGGFQITAGGIVNIGDRVDISGTEGIATDITWRHTVVRDYSNNTITVPNSVLNKSATIVKPKVLFVKVPVLVRYEDLAEGDTLDAFCARLEEPLREAVEAVDHVVTPPTIKFTEAGDYGYRGSVIVETEGAATGLAVQNAVVRKLTELAE